jgi:hypothetical protein
MAIIFWPKKSNSGYETPGSKDLKPSAWSWTGLTSRSTPGIMETYSKWMGRSRPLTGAGAHANIGATRTPSQFSNLQAQPRSQQQFGGTYVGQWIPVGVNDWVNPHTEPQNSVVVDQTAHAPSIWPFSMKGMGGGFNLVFKGADGLMPPTGKGGLPPNVRAG